MKCSQYNIRVFEVGVDDTESFLQFLEANLGLLKNHLISIQGNINQEIIDYLQENELHYVVNMKLPSAKRGVTKFKMLVPDDGVGGVYQEEAKDRVVRIDADDEEDEFDIRDIQNDFEEGIPPLKIVKGPLRSGQLIEYDGSVLVTDRINSGARIAALGSVIILGKVEGDISSVGDCVIIPPMKRGSLLFHGQRIENKDLIYPLNRVYFLGNQIVIKPIKLKELP